MVQVRLAPLLKEGESPANPLGHRLISVLSWAYRLYAKIRLATMGEWVHAAERRRQHVGAGDVRGDEE